MSDEIRITCPECSHSETVTLTPTFRLSYTLDADVTVEQCSNCGFEQLEAQE